MNTHAAGRVIALFLVLAGLPASPALAQGPAIQGDYLGTLGTLHLKLHVTVAADGTLSGAIDSPDQGAAGIPCADFHLQGNLLSFAVPSVHGTWQGLVGSDGATLSGTWNQGTPMPLTFTRDTFVAASKPSPVDGFWLGTLQVPGQSLRIQLTVRSDPAGQEFCTLDSLDQGAYGLACANVAWSGNDLSLEVPQVQGHWRGKLSGDGQMLSGTWTQGVSWPLILQRQMKVQLPPPPPKISYDPAIAPVDAAAMQAVLGPGFRAGAQERRDSLPQLQPGSPSAWYATACRACLPGEVLQRTPFSKSGPSPRPSPDWCSHRWWRRAR